MIGLKFRQLWVFYLALLVLSGWTITTAFASLAPNAISPQSAEGAALRGALVTMAPQRWEFFTASPQERQVAVYDNRGSAVVMRLPQTKSTNLFGLSREQRAQGPEIAILSGEIQHWVTCQPGQTRDCLSASSATVSESITNDVRRRSLCGEYVFAIQEPTPFEFRAFDYGNASALKAAKVDVLCN